MDYKRLIRSTIYPMAVLMLALLSSTVFAYGYSEAGKEPLIEGREALIGAMLANDKKGAETTLAFLTHELGYLEQSESVVLIVPLKEAVSNNQRAEVITLMNKAFAAEIKRRIKMAETSLDDYQQSKILVAKSKRFLEMLVVDMDDDDADRAHQSIKQCLSALGSPGVFGAGKQPPAPELYKKARAALFESLAQFE